MIWKRLLRRYTKRVEDSKKVEEKVTELSKLYPGTNWLPIDGFVSFPDAIYKPKDEVKFNLNVGYVAKAFMETKSGEIKFFTSRRFLKNE